MGLKKIKIVAVSYTHLNLYLRDLVAGESQDKDTDEWAWLEAK